jgi:hypothetical protein
MVISVLSVWVVDVWYYYTYIYIYIIILYIILLYIILHIHIYIYLYSILYSSSFSSFLQFCSSFPIFLLPSLYFHPSSSPSYLLFQSPTLLYSKLILSYSSSLPIFCSSSNHLPLSFILYVSLLGYPYLYSGGDCVLVLCFVLV